MPSARAHEEREIGMPQVGVRKGGGWMPLDPHPPTRGRWNEERLYLPRLLLVQLLPCLKTRLPYGQGLPSVNADENTPSGGRAAYWPV
jgi:hypothetical protein